MVNKVKNGGNSVQVHQSSGIPSDITIGCSYSIKNIFEPVLRRRKRNIDWEVPHTRDSEFAFHDVGLVYLTDEIVLNHKQPIKLVPAMILALTQETEQARDRSISAFKSRDSQTETVIKSSI